MKKINLILLVIVILYLPICCVKCPETKSETKADIKWQTELYFDSEYDRSFFEDFKKADQKFEQEFGIRKLAKECALKVDSILSEKYKNGE